MTITNSAQTKINKISKKICKITAVKIIRTKAKTKNRELK